ncbi:MAG: hypothetical protein AB8G77_08635 [Rhodothermales bacterium]
MLVIERTVGHPLPILDRLRCSMSDRINHLEVLEPLAWRHARAVVRGLGGRDPARLPDADRVIPASGQDTKKI